MKKIFLLTIITLLIGKTVVPWYCISTADMKSITAMENLHTEEA